MRRQNGYSLYIMAEVILKNLKKVYPNAESKKAKKGEPQKKGNLQITDEGVVAVQDFNLHIADKEFIVLVGPSGCGKSTTLRMIAGLEDISGGELTIGGKLMNDVEPKDRDIAMVFQSYALYPHMTVYENMAFSLKLKKLPKDSFIVKSISGGMRQSFLTGLFVSITAGRFKILSISGRCFSNLARIFFKSLSLSVIIRFAPFSAIFYVVLLSLCIHWHKANRFSPVF